jgi:predicted acyl esterase
MSAPRHRACSPAECAAAPGRFARRAAARALAAVLAAAPASAQERGTEWRDADRRDGPAAILAALPAGTTHRSERAALRDGVELATEIFLPPGGGPWPAVLMRTPYGRFNTAGYAGRLNGAAVAFVTQDPRADGDSGGPGTMSPADSENEMADGWDAVEWVARQPWCNGRVAMIGGSGHGLCACMAWLAGPSHLVAANPGNTAGNVALDWAFENGVRRFNYRWLSHRGEAVQEWPKPTLTGYDAAGWEARMRAAGTNSAAVFVVGDGWFNIFGDANLRWFEALAPTRRMFVTMGPGAHGKAEGLDFARAARGPRPAAEPVPPFLELLAGREAPSKSQLIYFMLGDVNDPAAPGNRWFATDVWPVPCEPAAWYLTAEGGLVGAAPSSADGAAAYAYDPRDPAPTIGGHHFYSGHPSGALDQRPLLGRPDVLRFATGPLAAPVAMTGRAVAELYLSADVPDTTFILKLVDVYPDGYEALIRETAFMARYRDGLDRPAPLEPGRVYRVALPLAATSIAFNAGHRIALYVTGSSTPAYEVHPNTWEPAMSFDASPVAHVTVHASAARPSRLVLPTVRP